MLDTKRIPLLEHLRWLDQMLALREDGQALLYILEHEGRPVVTARVSRTATQPERADISLTVRPSQRGEGHGAAMLHALSVRIPLEWGRMIEVYARIKRGNTASVRTFAGAGYSVIKRQEDELWDQVITMVRVCA